MEIISQIIIGSMVAGAGVAALKYNYELVGFTGHIDFVERYMGGGSTYLFVKMVSVLAILGGIIYILGLGDDMLSLILSPIINLFPKV